MVVEKDSYILWGRSIVAGEQLSSEERDELVRIHNGATHEIIIRVVGHILHAAAEDNRLRAIDTDPEPIIPADEITIRAREAFIATGELAGLEATIRAGRADHLIGIKTAIQVMRDRQHDLPALSRRLPEPRRTNPPETSPPPAKLNAVAAWFRRFEHRWARLITRYGGSRKRTLGLAQTIVALRRQAALDREQYNRQLLEAESRMVSIGRQHDAVIAAKDRDITHLHREAKQASDLLATRSLGSRAYQPESQIERLYARLPVKERQAVEELIRRAALTSTNEDNGQKRFSITINDEGKTELYRTNPRYR